MTNKELNSLCVQVKGIKTKQTFFSTNNISSSCPFCYNRVFMSDAGMDRIRHELTCAYSIASKHISELQAELSKPPMDETLD